MVNISNGKFIMPINDDLLCITKGYDDIILSNYDEKNIKILIGRNNYNYQGWYFPIVDKRITDELGYLSKCNFIDGYLYKSMKDLNIYNEIDITFNHLHLDDNITYDIKKTYENKFEKNVLYNKYYEEIEKYINEDKEKIKKLILKINNKKC